MENIKNQARMPLELTIDYILTRIDMILQNSSYINEAINAVLTMKINESPNGGFGDQERAAAISNSVQSRETTNQQIIKLLEKMYDDMKPKKAEEGFKFLDMKPPAPPKAPDMFTNLPEQFSQVPMYNTQPGVM